MIFSDNYDGHGDAIAKVWLRVLLEGSVPHGHARPKDCCGRW